MSLAHDRQRLAADYAARRKAHASRAAVAQQLKRTTTRQLQVQLAEEARAAERAKKVARAAMQPSLLADLDLFITNHG
ncbi:hypothetical protein [Ancylobacter vacuolatus]|uniref:Uncharacterized protein n=1 Tax=Ancylobacter vacuolatus TaxID=223389 RepID=A0ABU0DMY0_9HYPH|nr:hypothetical protein [Ancylobacter vacuolatus]MDQ0349767.1 hypothetical protein [Ancylobacter vacuolatus]